MFIAVLLVSREAGIRVSALLLGHWFSRISDRVSAGLHGGYAALGARGNMTQRAVCDLQHGLAGGSETAECGYRCGLWSGKRTAEKP